MELEQAIAAVLRGEIYLSPAVSSGVVSDYVQRLRSDELAPSPLTPRQREVLQQLCQGQTNKQIARVLDMQEKTVKGHVSAIFKALNVVHRLQAVEAARNAGLVS